MSFAHDRCFGIVCWPLGHRGITRCRLGRVSEDDCERIIWSGALRRDERLHRPPRAFLKSLQEPAHNVVTRSDCHEATDTAHPSYQVGRLGG